MRQLMVREWDRVRFWGKIFAGKRGSASAIAFGLGLALFLTLPAAAASVNKNAIAVIIGNKDYAGTVPDVDFAHNDARAMKRFVVEVLGYREGNILDLRDATKGRLEAVFGTAGYAEGQLHDWVKAGKDDGQMRARVSPCRYASHLRSVSLKSPSLNGMRVLRMVDVTDTGRMTGGVVKISPSSTSIIETQSASRSG